MGNSGLVRFDKLILERSELKKLTSEDRRRYLMLTSMARDLQVLQKLLLFATNDLPHSKIQRSADAMQLLFLIITLSSKLHEARRFIETQSLLDSIPESAPLEAQCARRAISGFFANQYSDIFKFIRDKFGFHYDTWLDLEPKIDDTFPDEEATIWISSPPGNHIFASTNDIVSQVLYGKMQSLGFQGDESEFLVELRNLNIDGSRVVTTFVWAYLRVGLACGAVTWRSTSGPEIEVPLFDQIILPPIVAAAGP